MNQIILNENEAKIVAAFFTRAFDAESGFEGVSEAVEYFIAGKEDDEIDTWARALGKLGVKGMMTRDGEVS